MTSIPTRTSRERPDLLAPGCAPDIKITELAATPGEWTSHIYMEAHVFTPDSERFVYKRFRGKVPPGNGREEYDLMLCDLAEGNALRQMTDCGGVTAPSVTPDGQWLLYFVDEAHPGGGRFSLERVSLETFRRETILVVDAPPAGAEVVPSRLYALSSVSSDGRRLCTSGFLGDGRRENAPWGLLVCDLERATCEAVWRDVEACNLHPQYCRSLAPEAARDVLIQHNHGSRTAPDGVVQTSVAGGGADIHVIRDDGSRRRDLPWGRDGRERCQGHQAWRGRGTSAITTNRVPQKGGRELSRIIEGHPVPVEDSLPHLGRNTPGGRRLDVSGGIERPDFCHFAVDASGTRMVVDSDGRYDRANSGKLWTATLSEDGLRTRFRFLLNSRATNGREQYTHAHPFLSPDCRRVFFNSDVSGEPHIFMVEGLEW